MSCALLTSIRAVAFGVRTPPKSATHHCGGSGSDSCINVVVSIALVQVQVQALCKPQVAGYNIRSSSARLACTTGALVLAPPGRRGTGPRLCHTPRRLVQTASLRLLVQNALREGACTVTRSAAVRGEERHPCWGRWMSSSCRLCCGGTQCCEHTNEMLTNANPHGLTPLSTRLQGVADASSVVVVDQQRQRPAGAICPHT